MMYRVFDNGWTGRFSIISDRPPPTLRCDFPLLGVFHGFPIPFHDDGDPRFGLSRSQLSPRLVG